jgi:hypothetical protein
MKKKGTAQLSSTAFNSDDNGLSSRNVQYLWTAGKNTAPEQTELSKNRNKFSLTTSQSGQYFHIYSSQNITPQQAQNAPRFYILCSP